MPCIPSLRQPLTDPQKISRRHDIVPWRQVVERGSGLGTSAIAPGGDAGRGGLILARPGGRCCAVLGMKNGRCLGGIYQLIQWIEIIDEEWKIFGGIIHYSNVLSLFW